MADLLDERLLRQKVEANLAIKNRILREIYDAQSFTVEEILHPYLRYAGWLAPYITDTAMLLTRWIEAGYQVLFEGAQATMQTSTTGRTRTSRVEQDRGGAARHRCAPADQRRSASRRPTPRVGEGSPSE